MVPGLPLGRGRRVCRDGPVRRSTAVDDRRGDGRRRAPLPVRGARPAPARPAGRAARQLAGPLPQDDDPAAGRSARPRGPPGPDGAQLGLLPAGRPAHQPRALPPDPGARAGRARDRARVRRPAVERDRALPGAGPLHPDGRGRVAGRRRPGHRGRGQRRPPWPAAAPGRVGAGRGRGTDPGDDGQRAGRGAAQQARGRPAVDGAGVHRRQRGGRRREGPPPPPPAPVPGRGGGPQYPRS